jgi:hypothetical protein
MGCALNLPREWNLIAGSSNHPTADPPSSLGDLSKDIYQSELQNDLSSFPRPADLLLLKATAVTRSPHRCGFVTPHLCFESSDSPIEAPLQQS